MPRPDVPNTLYFDIHHDPTPPGSSRPAGYWANQAWLSLSPKERKALQHPELARSHRQVYVMQKRTGVAQGQVLSVLPPGVHEGVPSTTAGTSTGVTDGWT